MPRMKHEIVWKTDVYLTQEEYDELFRLFQLAMILSIGANGVSKAEIDLVTTKHQERYENYRIHLSDKYNIELLRSDGSYFACEELRIVYVLDVAID